MYPVQGSDLFEGLNPNMKWNTNILSSYETKYNYPKSDSVVPPEILNAIKKDVYKVGLVKTYDNTIESIFHAFSVSYDTLTPDNIAYGDLSIYQTIILDLRTYFYRSDVVLNNKRLLDYSENGGNLIVLYNKPQDWNNKGYFAPYGIYISSERVTEEDAPVKILKPDNSIFNRPNKINDNDWKGWVQERNVYLPSMSLTRTDSNSSSRLYDQLLAMQDEDDPVPSTSLLWTRNGKGTYTYCSLALYRQLKIFHEGAIKLFMNMISQKPAKPKFDN